MNSTDIELSSSPPASLETSMSLNESDSSTASIYPTTTSNLTSSLTTIDSTNSLTTSDSTSSLTTSDSTNSLTTSDSTNSLTTSDSTSSLTTSDSPSNLTTTDSTSISTTSDPTSSSTNNYSTNILTTPYPANSSTTNCSTSSSTTNYATSTSNTNYPTTTYYTSSSTALSIPNLTDKSPAHNLSGDVGLIFGGIIGSLSLITIVIIVLILIHKRIHHRRGSSYRPKSKGVKVLPTKDNVGNYKASKVLGGRYEDIDLTEGLSENATQNDQTLTEIRTENYCYVNPKTLESVEAADSIYNHLGTDGSNEPVRDDTYHHIDVNFQPCQPSTNDSNHGKENNNYDHIHLAASKSGVQNLNYSHIEVNNIRSEKCDSNYDHISVPHQVSSNHCRNDNYHHIAL